MNSDWEQYNTNTEAIGVYKQSIEDIKLAIEKNEAEKKELNNIVEKISESDELKALNERINNVTKMKNIFGGSVEMYRTQIRNEVQQKASEFFKNVIDEPDYIKLK